MKFKYILAGAGALLASSGAMAGNLAGNVSVVSDYMFRGLDQSDNGAAVQGGVDYGWDMGAYVGGWVTNSAAAGGNEADLYGGYSLKLGGFDLDAGAIYYGYTEDTESSPSLGGGVTNHNYDYAEIYVGGSFGPGALKVFYAPKFGKDTDAVSGNGKKDAAIYATASVMVTLTDTVSLTPQVGYSTGDGVKDAFGDNYLDYSITATKKLKDDFSVSVAVVGTNAKDFNGVVDNKDNPKFVLGVKKNFNI